MIKKSRINRGKFTIENLDSASFLEAYAIIIRFHGSKSQSEEILHETHASRDNFDIVIREDGIYYTNLGIDYPLRDTAALRKFYKENKKVDLKPLNPDVIPE